MAEACIPGINLVDLGSMFEEHRIVKNLSVFLNTHQLELGGGGVFGEDENKFIFGHVLVGRKAKARFKISNAYKVCWNNYCIYVLYVLHYYALLCLYMMI